MNDLSTAQAAQILNMTESGVKRAILRGKLTAVKAGRNWRIKQADVDNFHKSNSGRPAKNAKHTSI